MDKYKPYHNTPPFQLLSTRLNYLSLPECLKLIKIGFKISRLFTKLKFNQV